MERKDLVVTGPDAAELAALLKIPSLGTNQWGWRDLLGLAADSRVLRIRQLESEMGMTVTVTVTAAEDPP